MLFNSLTFVGFFVVFFVLYWGVFNLNTTVRNWAILAGSYVFYAYWDWRFLSLIILSSAVDYVVGRSLEKTDKRIYRRLILAASLTVNLGALAFFKYFNFFIDSAALLLESIGFQANQTSLQIILPVGISFYTFQTLSYSIDVYRRKIVPCRSLTQFFAYVAFFPQLVAGPIERAANLLPQFQKRHRFATDDGLDAAVQILWGFFKKVVIADNAAVFVDAIFSNPGEMSSFVLVFGLVLFAIQIYCDFSGYSDIAIGVARLLGFRLMTNFSYPYFSRDIGEFWRRWHISLSTWFRDYLYIPLGGSKGGKLATIRNVLIVFTISGLWHGASWNFVVWGFLNGLLFLPLILCGLNRRNLDSCSAGRLFPTLRDSAAIITTFSLVCFCWLFFRSASLGDAIA